MLILGSFDAVQAAFVNQDDVFSARPKFRFIESFMKDSSIVLTDGDKWQEHRRFAFRTLRDFGFRKSLFDRHTSGGWLLGCPNRPGGRKRLGHRTSLLKSRRQRYLFLGVRGSSCFGGRGVSEI